MYYPKHLRAKHLRAMYGGEMHKKKKKTRGTVINTRSHSICNFKCWLDKKKKKKHPREPI
jgi:hypothetical protein